MRIKPGVVETSDYLPFGTRWSRTGGSLITTLTDSTKRWRYSGKEEQKAFDSALQLIDYGARMYDPTIVRWMSTDSLAEKYYPVGPYVYCAGNPVVFVDPQGDTVRVYVETERFGHAWISVGEESDMIVFSYGRYDGTNKGGSFSNGPGVLLKLTGEDATDYNEKKSNTGYYSFTIPDVNDDDVLDILNTMFDSSEVLPNNEKSDYYKSPTAHVIDDYKLLSINCTTTVSDVLNSAGSSVLKGQTFQPAGSFGANIYSTVPVTHRFVNPRSLLNYLQKSNIPVQYVKK